MHQLLQLHRPPSTGMEKDLRAPQSSPASLAANLSMSCTAVGQHIKAPISSRPALASLTITKCTTGLHVPAPQYRNCCSWLRALTASPGACLISSALLPLQATGAPAHRDFRVAVSPDSEPLEHHQVLLQERTRLCSCLALTTRLNPLLSVSEVNELVVLLSGIAQHAEGVTGSCLRSCWAGPSRGRLQTLQGIGVGLPAGELQKPA